MTLRNIATTCLAALSLCLMANCNNDGSLATFSFTDIDMAINDEPTVAQLQFLSCTPSFPSIYTASINPSGSSIELSATKDQMVTFCNKAVRPVNFKTDHFSCLVKQDASLTDFLNRKSEDKLKDVYIKSTESYLFQNRIFGTVESNAVALMTQGQISIKGAEPKPVQRTIGSTRTTDMSIDEFATYIPTDNQTFTTALRVDGVGMSAIGSLEIALPFGCYIGKASDVTAIVGDKQIWTIHRIELLRTPDAR